jgi:phage-related protein
MKNNFEVQFFEEVIEFFDKLPEKAREKILYNVDKSQKKNDKKLFKKLNRDIWEFRTLYNKIQYRLFAFWDKTDKTFTIVIATHGIIKKTKKTPKKEIEKAEKLMAEYFNSKK